MSHRSPIFIVGCYRSGTSVLRLILSAHSKIHIPRETRYIPGVVADKISYSNLNEGDSLKLLIHRIRHSLVGEQWDVLPTVSNIKSACKVLTLHNVIQEVSLLECPLDKRENIQYWGDKTPINVMYIPVLAEFFPDAKFVNVVRDGRDVFASVKHLHIGGARSAVGAALEWNERILGGIIGRDFVGHEKFISLKYEDLVSSPENTLMRLCDFLGIEFETQLLNFYELDQSINLAEQRHHANVRSPLNTRSIGAYRKKLTSSDIQEFELYTHNILKLFGYSPDFRFALQPSTSIRYGKLSINFFRVVVGRIMNLFQ